jgi:hypothetical protein
MGFGMVGIDDILKLSLSILGYGDCTRDLPPDAKPNFQT